MTVRARWALVAVLLLATGVLAWAWLLAGWLAPGHPVTDRGAGPAIAASVATPPAASSAPGRWPDGAADPAGGTAAAALRDTLADPDRGDTTPARVAEIARASGLAPGRIEPSRDDTPGAMLARVKIAVPVTGDYLALRRFVGALLTELPGVSIDEVDVQRQPDGTGITGTVRVSAWRTGRLPLPPGMEAGP